MNTCGTCAYWEIKDWMDRENGHPIGFCQSEMVCKPTYGLGDKKVFSPFKVFTCDEGGCTGELMTGSEFGCIHWRAKE
jgi:hypothetical protein